jgi:hypothetical protein
MTTTRAISTRTASPSPIPLPKRETLRQRLTRFCVENQARALREADARPKPPTLKEMLAADRADIHAELKAIDRRLVDIASTLGRVRPGLLSPELAEMNIEYKNLFDIRRDIRNDLEHPIDHDRDGRPLDVRQRLIRRERANSLRETCWAQSEKFRRESLYRESRRWRLDSCRSRALAEAELGWRPHPGTFW